MNLAQMGLLSGSRGICTKGVVVVLALAQAHHLKLFDGCKGNVLLLMEAKWMKEYMRLHKQGPCSLRVHLCKQRACASAKQSFSCK